jgi:RNA polymerase sigma-70 factor (ECF subfamily)
MTLLAKNPPRPSDYELLMAIAAGDRRALETLYLSYFRRLARFLSRFTPRYENVEEIVNDTFMSVWQGARDFRNASQVSTWIFGIAYRTALKSLRQQKHHSCTGSIDDYPEQAIDPAQDAEIRDWLTQGLNQLPLEQRLTLELAYHAGYSLEEIALITDCPVGTVKARMFYAREKMRHFLPALGGGATEFSVSRP